MSKGLIAACLMASFGLLSSVHADGIVQNASKDAAKGAVKGVQQEMNNPELVKGAKEMAKGMVDGVSNAVPTMTSQMINQTNVNRKALGNVARTVTKEAVAGVINESTHSMEAALGKDAEGPLATTLVASTEKVTAAVVRGLASEIKVDPATAEKLSAAAVRGAMSEIHVQIPVWSMLIAFVLGGFASLLLGGGLMVLFMLFQRRRAVAVEPAPTTVRTGAALSNA
jgi:hypothetical protein